MPECGQDALAAISPELQLVLDHAAPQVKQAGSVVIAGMPAIEGCKHLPELEQPRPLSASDIACNPATASPWTLLASPPQHLSCFNAVGAPPIPFAPFV